MYNKFIKLTERHQRDSTRTIYVNLLNVNLITGHNGGARLFIGSNMSMNDVLETPEKILGLEAPVVLTDKVENAGSRNEDGRVSNPAE